MNKPPCVFMVDDNRTLRQCVGLLLESEGINFQLFETLGQFLESYIAGTSGCLLYDYNIPGMDTNELHYELDRHQIDLPIIFLSSYGDEFMIVNAIKAGADDFLIKPIQKAKLIEHIHALLQSGYKEYTSGTKDWEIDKRLLSLTVREKEILALAVTGLPNKYIAQKLGISYRTIENHRRRILKKSGAANFMELAHLK